MIECQLAYVHNMLYYVCVYVHNYHFWNALIIDTLRISTILHNGSGITSTMAISKHVQVHVTVIIAVKSRTYINSFVNNTRNIIASKANACAYSTPSIEIYMTLYSLLSVYIDVHVLLTLFCLLPLEILFLAR